jgi:discoidin domain receptor family member 2
MHVQGYDWVGWTNDSASLIVVQSLSGSLSAPAVEMSFRFDGLRNFTSVTLHCNNMYSRDVRVFRSAHPAVSRDGITFTPVEPYVTAPVTEPSGGGRSGATSPEAVRDVTVPLHGAIGRYVRLKLEFNARWMLISEVEFNSGIDSANIFA